MPRDRIEIEGTAFFAELAMEHDLQEKIAEFLDQLEIVAGLNGIQQFIHFLDGVPAEGEVILLAVPRATGGRTKPSHDFEKVIDCWLWRFRWFFSNRCSPS